MVKKITLNISYLHKRHYKKALSADEAIFMAGITGTKDCFVVPPRNDDLSLMISPEESLNRNSKKRNNVCRIKKLFLITSIFPQSFKLTLS